MKYIIRYESRAVKQLSKLDGAVKRMIKAWIEKNLAGTENPRQHGKALTGDKKEYWRYRIGDYRLIAEIRDDELLIIAIALAHRSEVYKKGL